jgi:S-DNA-T family DNA segregation ATPase FtsK/SpoIIIE
MRSSDIEAIKKERKNRLLLEIKGVVALAFSVYLALIVFTYDKWDQSSFTYSTSEVKNYGGIVGAYMADVLFMTIGVSSYMMPFGFFIYGLRRILGAQRNWFYRVGIVLLVISIAALAELLSRTTILNISLSGGLFGYLIAEHSLNLLSRGGAYILVVSLLFIAVLLLSPVSPVLLLRDLKRKGPQKVDLKPTEALSLEHPTPEQSSEMYNGHDTLIEDPQITPITDKVNAEDTVTREMNVYRLPPLDLLRDAEEADLPSRADIQAAVSGLEKKLLDFGVSGRIRQANPGPVVTMYEYEPAPGIKINRVVSLADDLALALKAQSVRVYPIPGKAAIGIEVPNKNRATIALKEVIASDTFQKSLSLLSLALGKDISGMPVVTDLSRMPHLLVAGTTGSGKSVFMNTMILSLLYKATPEQVKMLMIDPKLLELSLYADIPHLITPVITNPKEASEALKSLVFEMERRYKAISEKGARSIDTFNRVCEPEERLPYIVIFIDELADLMFTAPKDVEGSITRLAQKARASGIHLILATQRPSVDVITGLIKANFPARISFQVTSKIDSRTILDSQGAEQLLGKGDMLFMIPGIKIIRVHGAYVSEAEVVAITNFIKAQASPDYTGFEHIAQRATDTEDTEDTAPGDEYYKKAKEYAESVGEISISAIQRRLKIGYNKAAMIMEMFERDGLVGPPKGAGKPREYIGKRQG